MNWKLIAPWVAAVVSLGALVWYYGEVRHDEGVSEVEMRIAEGKYDRWFVSYETLPAPRPQRRTVRSEGNDSIDHRVVDSLVTALMDSSAVIHSLSSPFKTTLRDSVVLGEDSLQFVFQAVHHLTVDRLRQTVEDFFEVMPITIPVKEKVSVVLRDPTFWEDVEKVLYGTGLGFILALLFILL